jgi:hypothetical protein
MNLNKLRNVTCNKSTENSTNDSFERFIQNARVNEELQKMNQIVTYEEAKNYLIDLFKDNKDYEIFDKEKELKRNRHIIIPTNLQWKKDSFAIWNPNKNCGFVLYTNDDIKKYYEFSLVAFSNDKSDIQGLINCANEFDDLKSKIDFYINSYDYLKENIEEIDFNKLTIDYNWFAYTDLKNLTSDCIKFESEFCKIKKCENCNKCNMFISKLEYTQNMYNYNKLINTFIETICKLVKKPTSISEEMIENNKIIRYKIGNLGIDITTCSMKDKLYSSASVLIYTNKKDVVIPLYSSDEKLYSNNGKEQFDLYFALLHEFAFNKSLLLSYAKMK